MRIRLLHLFPDGWRRRYGCEFESLLQDLPLTPALVWDVLLAALVARWELRVGDDLALPPLRSPSRPLPAIFITTAVVTFVTFAVGIAACRPMGLLSLPISAFLLLAGLASTFPAWRYLRTR